jgi:hypothetical protein
VAAYSSVHPGLIYHKPIAAVTASRVAPQGTPRSGAAEPRRNDASEHDRGVIEVNR